MDETTLKFIKIYKKIESSSNILLLIHSGPDGDCIGASFSLYNFIKQLNISVDIFSIDKIPNDFYFLNIKTLQNVNTNNYDLFILLDVNSIERCGLVDINYKNIIIIDHHKKTDLRMPFEEVVLPQKSSTCEIIFDFFYLFNFNINPIIATALFIGILTDTSNFNNAATNKESLDIANKLIASGVDIKCIQNNLFKNKSLNSLNIWEILFNRLRKNNKISLSWTFFSKKDFNLLKIDENDISYVSNFMNNLNDSNVGMIIKSVGDNKIKFSLRTTKNIDLLKIASIFGGGGHKKACGFEINGKIIKNKDGNIKII